MPTTPTAAPTHPAMRTYLRINDQTVSQHLSDVSIHLSGRERYASKLIDRSDGGTPFVVAESEGEGRGLTLFVHSPEAIDALMEGLSAAREMLVVRGAA